MASKLLIVASVATCFAQEPPVLTVSEVLHDLRALRGKSVIVVGIAVWTLDGGFISDETCRHKADQNGATEDAMVAEGMIALEEAPGAPRLPTSFKWPRASIAAKAQNFHIEEKAPSAAAEPNPAPKAPLLSERAEVVALFGRIVAPWPYRPPRREDNCGIGGNGYGANGSARALLLMSPSEDHKYMIEKLP